MGACGLRGCRFLNAPLLEEAPNFFAEVLSNNDIQDGVENAVEEG